MLVTRLFRKPRRLAIGLGAILAAVATYGYAAGSTVPGTGAGDGSGPISGYTITGVKFTLDAVNPALIASVRFTVDPVPVAGSTIKAKLVAAGTNWYTCTAAAATVTCPTTAPPASTLAADNLRVVIVQ